MVEPLDTKAWVMVPVEPTPEMLAAVPASHSVSFQAIWPKICGDIYRAMLSASPSLPVVDGGETAEKSEALAREYRPTMDKDIVHAWGADAAAALSESASLISSQKQQIAALMNERTSLIETKREQIERLTKEREEAQGKLALLIDRIVYADSYGVPGSDFQCCHLCAGGGAPGIPFEHDERCPVRHLERDYANWFEDIRATEQALWETETRASAAESRLQSLEEEVKRLRRESTDRAYMLEAYGSMLGPTALKVVEMWAEKHVKRVHHSWGPEAVNLTGEERAQLLLEWEAAMETAVEIRDIDSHLSQGGDQ